eukprot:UN16560
MYFNFITLKIYKKMSLIFCKLKKLKNMNLILQSYNKND